MKEFRFLWFWFLKACFDKGWSWTNQLKYIFVFAGLFDLIDIKQAIWGITAYIIFCFILGWVGFKYGWVDAENEVQNRYNPFQKEVREKLHTTLSKRFK